jgi:hypothetical protein
MQLANFGNIPRKQSKFENFVKNSLKLTDLHIIGELWESFTGKAKVTGMMTLFYSDLKQ